MQLSRTPFAMTLVLAFLTPTLFAQDDPSYVKPDDSKDTPAERQQEEAPIIQQDDSGTIEGFGETWRGLKRLERIQFLSNIETIRASTPLLPPIDVVTPLDFSVKRPAPLGRPDVDPLLGSPLEPLMSPIRNVESYLQDNHGLNFGIYYTLLYQHVSDPVADSPRNFGTGRLDVNLVWNLWEYPVKGHLDAGEVGHGLLGVLVRQGNQIGVPNDVNTAESVGSIQGLDSLYTGQYGGAATLNLLYYQQGFLDDRCVVSVGKVHPNQYIGLNFWANDESRQFIAGSFDGIQTLGPSQGGYQLGVALQLIPTDWMFVNTMVTDALGTPYTMFSTLDEGYHWGAVEAGFILPPFGEHFAGPTCLSVIWSTQNIDALSAAPRKQTSNSLALQLQGHLATDVGVWAQGGVADEHMSTIEREFSCGIGFENPFGNKGDMFGLAFNWSKPSGAINAGTPGFTTAPDEQSMIEAFYRIQLTSSCQLSPDLQVVLDPGAREGGSASVILGLRLTTDF
jgi:porin